MLILIVLMSVSAKIAKLLLPLKFLTLENPMLKINLSDLDYIEISQPSSPDLRENVQNILRNSTKYSAAVTSLDNGTGVYEIVLKGKLKKSNIV